MVIHPDLYKFCNGDQESQKIVLSFINEISSNEELLKINTQDGKDIRSKKLSKTILKIFESVFTYFENDIRSNHAKRSAQLIRQWNKGILNYLDPLLVEEVAKVSESHGWNAIEIYGLKSKAKDSQISEKYMMMLIRLADLLDVANDRINYYLLRQNVAHLSPKSRFHWISHLITDEIQIAPTYNIEKDKKLNEQPIVEQLNFNIYLNVKYDTLLHNNDKCKLCYAKCSTNGSDVAQKHEYANDSLSKAEIISIQLYAQPHDNIKSCPIMCRWIAKKHDWLIKELRELQKYLNSVNSMLFRNEINFNIIYSNEQNLDADLFDDVLSYIDKPNVSSK
jgi:hypothetical protein